MTNLNKILFSIVFLTIIIIGCVMSYIMKTPDYFITLSVLDVFVGIGFGIFIKT